MNFNLPDPLTLIVLTAVLSLAPFFAVMMTSYVKLVVVLSLVRNALGVQQIPPNLVINGLAVGKILGFLKPKFGTIYENNTVEDFGVLSCYVAQ